MYDDLRRFVRIDLEAWVDTREDLEELTNRIVDQLESGLRRAYIKVSAGQLRWVLSKHCLLTEYPNGSKRVRTLR